MKKIVSAVLALCMVLCLGVNAFAASIAPAADKTEIKAGETVQVTLKFDSKLTNVRFFETRLYYNPTYFNYPTLETGGVEDVVLGARQHYDTTNERYGQTYATINYLDITSQGVAQEGTFAVLNFVARTDISKDDVAEFDFVIADCLVGGQDNSVSAGSPVSVTVGPDKEAFTRGDVTNDGKIDLFDAIRVIAYYNKQATLAETQLLAADVTGDGKVDLFDAIRIIAYYNKVNSEL